MASELKLDDTELLAAIDLLKGVSAEQQEAAILALEEQHPGIGNRAGALLALERQTAQAIAKLEGHAAITSSLRVKAAAAKEAEGFFKNPTAQPIREEPKLEKPKVEGSIRRKLSVDLIAGVPKPKPEEPKPEEEEPRKAAVSRGSILDRGPVTKWPKEWPEAPLPPADTTPYERLLYPKGLLGHATQYVLDTAGLPDRKMALGVSLSALAKGMDRRVVGPSGNSVILFILIIAETGAGKQHGLDCVRTLLRAMGLEHCYAAGGLASVQSIEEIIEGIPGSKGTAPNPNALVVIDEFGSWLLRIMTGQVGNVAEIPAHLQVLWGLTVDGVWMGIKKLGKEMRGWHSVAFALIGFSTEKAFFGALKDKLLGSGFVNRMLLFNVGRGAAERVDPKYGVNQCDGWLVKALRRVTNLETARDHEAMLLPLPGIDGTVITFRDFHRMNWVPKVKELCRAFEKEIRAMPSVQDREIWIRTHDIALRLATIHVFYRCSAVVELGDWEWAVGLANHSTQELKDGVDKHMSENLPDADLAECIREFGRSNKHRYIRLGELHKLLERKTGDVRKIDAVIWHVVKIGDLIEVPPEEARSDPRGKPTTYFKWNRK